MDERTARDAARIRGRGALAAAVLGDVLALGCVVFAITGPAEVRPFLWAAAALGAVGGVGSALVQVVNSRLAVDPSDLRPRAALGPLVVALVVAWVGAVLVVWLVTGEAAYGLASLGLVVLLLPPVVLALVTAKGPHPS